MACGAHIYYDHSLLNGSVHHTRFFQLHHLPVNVVTGGNEPLLAIHLTLHGAEQRRDQELRRMGSCILYRRLKFTNGCVCKLVGLLANFM